jgi:hypothetical protein
MVTPKEDATQLMNMMLPLAEQMLREYGEFYPYGGVMLADGSMQSFAAADGNEYPRSTDLIGMLEDTFREHAHEGRYRATGIVYDVRTVPPGTIEKTDAIALRLDHESGYSVVVFIPYRLSDGQIAKGTTFAVKGEGSIFPPPA